MHAQRTKCGHKCSPCHYVTGELKTEWKNVSHVNEAFQHDE